MSQIDVEHMIKEVPSSPKGRLVWTALVDVGERVDLGSVPGGRRFMVPILGGRVVSGPGIKGLDGIVLAGGADRQLLRADGVKELDALYEIKTDDGQIITIRNRVIVDDGEKLERYAMSVIGATVPDGPLSWLNRRLLLGTLQSLRPERSAVIVRAWEMNVG